MNDKFIIVLSTLPLLFLLSCTKQKVANLTKDKLENATYFEFTNLGSLGAIKLTSGHFKSEQQDTIDSVVIRNESSLDLLDDQIAFGDLRGDGREYAAVFLAEGGRGTGLFISINAIVDSNGTPYHITSCYLGDRITIDTVFISDRIIYVDAVIQSGNHGAFPDSSVSWQFKLDNNVLKEITGARFYTPPNQALKLTE
jgi:hypothetical protein